MKSVLLSGLIALLLVSWAHGQEEEEVPVCHTEDAYIPHVNCTKYYQCVNFVPFERICSGEGQLYWNQRIYECDYPENVPECIGGTRPPWEGPNPTTEMPQPTTTTGTPGPTTTTTTETPTTTTVSPSICTDPDRIYFLPDPTDPTCTRYIACYHGFPTPLNCPEGLLFNPAEGQCVRPENYQCPGSTTTTQPPSTTTTMQPPTTTTRPPTTTTTTQPPTTTTTQLPTTTTQPPTTTTTTQPPSTTTTAPPNQTTENLFPCPNDPFIYMPHYASCHDFYLCIDGELAGHLTCGDFLHFNSDFQGCVPPEESDCVPQPLP